MGQLDWADLDGSLSIATLKRGVTAEINGPNGSNGFVYGYNSLDGTVTGAHGKYVDLTGFTPTGSDLAVPDGGGSVRAAMKRVSSTNNTGMTPFIFFCAQGGSPNVNDSAYMLGLLDADPYRIVLAKGPMVGGIVESDDESETKILAIGSEQFAMGDGLWHQLRMDPIVQPNGDVLIKVYQSDLNTRVLENPEWVNVPGFNADGYIDGVLEINSGSAPLWGGYVGYGFAINQALNRRGAFDGIQAYRSV